MKKTVVFLLFFFLILAISVSVLFFLKKSFKENEYQESYTVEYIEKGEGVKISNLKGDIILEYYISEFREWATKNWSDIFEEPPSFGELRDVNPEHFYVFDDTASLSPKNTYLAFSVSDYAAATDISFVGILNLKTKKVFLITGEVFGKIRDFTWSPQETYIAYVLDTAKAPGDYLSADNIKEAKKEFVLSGNEVMLNHSEKKTDIEFMPNFKILEWLENGMELRFITLSDIGENIEWTINLKEKVPRKVSVSNN